MPFPLQILKTICLYSLQKFKEKYKVERKTCLAASQNLLEKFANLGLSCLHPGSIRIMHTRLFPARKHLCSIKNKPEYVLILKKQTKSFLFKLFP